MAPRTGNGDTINETGISKALRAVRTSQPGRLRKVCGRTVSMTDYEISKRAFQDHRERLMKELEECLERIRLEGSAASLEAKGLLY